MLDWPSYSFHQTLSLWGSLRDLEHQKSWSPSEVWLYLQHPCLPSLQHMWMLQLHLPMQNELPQSGLSPNRLLSPAQSCPAKQIQPYMGNPTFDRFNYKYLPTNFRKLYNFGPDCVVCCLLKLQNHGIISNLNEVQLKWNMTYSNPEFHVQNRNFSTLGRKILESTRSVEKLWVKTFFKWTPSIKNWWSLRPSVHRPWPKSIPELLWFGWFQTRPTWEGLIPVVKRL